MGRFSESSTVQMTLDDYERMKFITIEGTQYTHATVRKLIREMGTNHKVLRNRLVNAEDLLSAAASTTTDDELCDEIRNFLDEA